MEREALERLLKELAGGGAVIASSWWLGRALLAHRARGLTRPELELFSFALGAAALSQIVFVLGLLGLYYDAVFGGLAAGCLAAWFRWGRDYRQLDLPTFEEDPFWRRTAFVVAVFYGPLYLLNALAPDAGPDSLGYHLGLASRYYREHGLTAATGNIYGLFPQGVETLYVFAFAFGRHNAPHLVHFAFFAATLAALVSLGRRLGSAAVGWTAALLYGLTPVVAYDAVLAYNDCALALYELLTLYALLLWREDRAPWTAVATGVFAGFCYAVKMTGGLVVVAAGAALLGLSRGRLRPIALYGAAALLFVGAWAGRNLVIAGSPTAPFYNEAFPTPYATTLWEQGFRDFVSDYRHAGERSEGSDPLWKLWEVTVGGERLGGFTGPVFWAAPLALLGWRRRGFAPFALALAVAVIPWFSNAGTRFLIPALAFLSLLMALGLQSLGRGARWAGLALVAFHGVSVWPTVAEQWLAEPRIFRIEEEPWRVVLGFEPWEVFVQRHNAAFTGARGLAKSAPPGSRALAFDLSADAYFPGEILDSRFSVLGGDALRDLLLPVEPDLAPTWRIRLLWDAAREVQELELRQTAAGPVEWEIAEIRTIPQAELRVEPDRRPWTADRLSDGDPLSVWRSGSSLTPARLTVRLARPARIEGLEIVTPLNQRDAKFEISHFPARIAIDRLQFSPAALRAAAHNSLRNKGIGYLMGNLDAGGHSVALAPIDRDPAAWGLREVWREGPWRAFQVLPQAPPSATASETP
ncbi:MAG: hypothetical protein GC160_06550 [Acidobacteria bacterium]|nr:hypothetical protein [Acidobacteriota bacterium]